MSKAQNAVLALSRAMYGKRITDKQYREMLGLKTTNEIAAYLKNRTAYSKVFESVNINNFTPKILDDIVSRHFFSHISKFCRLENAIGQDFYRYFIARLEIEQILKCTMHILGGKHDDYLAELSNFFDSHVSIDLFALAKANTLGEISLALRGTDYGKVFDKCMANAHIGYLVFETAFNSHLLSLEEKLIKDCFDGKEEKAVLEAMSRRSDIAFIEKLTRIMRYYNNQNDIKSSLAPTKMTLFSEREIEKLIRCESLEELDAVLKKTPYKEIANLSGADNIQMLTRTYLFEYYSKQIRFSVYPCVVMYSYLFLSRCEADNITRIIDGNKYSIAPEEIYRNLVGAGYRKEKEGDYFGN